MSRTGAYHLGWILFLLGAPLIWAAARIFARPVESVKSAREWGQRGHRLPGWLLPAPESVAPLTRFTGAVWAFFGVVFVAGGLALLYASRG